MKCSIQLCFASLNGTFHLSPHENICTIALINIHYLYTIKMITEKWDLLYSILDAEFGSQVQCFFFFLSLFSFPFFFSLFLSAGFVSQEILFLCKNSFKPQLLIEVNIYLLCF